MPVVAVWKCDRDNTMFDNKKDAEEHDKMLELAANITRLLEQEIKDLDEKHSETIGLILAKRKDALAKACKGKPDALLETTAEKSDQKVTPIASNNVSKNAVAN